MSNSFICAYPWLGATIRPSGDVLPCCKYSDNYDSVKLKSDMIQGRPSIGCAACYKEEASGHKSLRLQSLDYFIPTAVEDRKLHQLEIAFSNLCNLACVSCSKEFSSYWHEQDYKNGRASKTKALNHRFDISSLDLTELKLLKIIGGEPFMESRKFTNLLENLDREKLSVQICTNATVMPTEYLKNKLLECKNISLTVSLDGLESVNDWYRWPSKFENVINNVKGYQEEWSCYNNVNFKIHCVINIFNVLYLEEFVDYMLTNFPKWTLDFNWIQYPTWQRIENLPDSTKSKLIDTLSDVHPFGPTKFKLLNEPRSDSWETVCVNIKQLAQERKLDFGSMVTKFNDILI